MRGMELALLKGLENASAVGASHKTDGRRDRVMNLDQDENWKNRNGEMKSVVIPLIRDLLGKQRPEVQ